MGERRRLSTNIINVTDQLALVKRKMAHFEKTPEVVCVLSSGQGSRGGVDRIQSSGQLCADAHAGAAVGCRADLGIENSGRFGRGLAQYLVRQNEQAKVGRFYNFPARSIATANHSPSTAAIR